MDNATQGSQTLDFSEYVAILRRRRRLMVAIALPIVAIAAGFAIGLPDVYRSVALINFDRAEISGELQPAARGEPTYADQYVSSLAENVLVKPNLKPMLETVQIAPDQAEESGNAIDMVIDGTSVNTVRETVLDPDSGREREVISAFSVAFEHSDPAVAQKGAAWLADAFLRASRKMLQERAVAAAQFYANEANRFRTNIAELEGKLSDFKAKNMWRLPELADTNLGGLDRTQQTLDDTNSQIRQLNQDRIFLVQRIQEARTTGPDVGLLKELEAEYSRKAAIYDPNHPDIVALKRQIDNLRAGGSISANASLPEQLASQRAILATARQRYSDDHPDIKRTMREIETLEARIARGERAPSIELTNPLLGQLQAQLSVMDNQLGALQLRSLELRAKLSEFEQRIEGTPLVEREYQSLTRDLELARKKYDDLLSNQIDAELKQAAIGAGRSDELKLMQPPGLPAKPAKPMRGGFLIIGFVFACAVALAAAIVAETMDQNVRGSRDVSRLLAVTPLAVVPDMRDAALLHKLRMRAAVFAGAVLFGTVALVLVLRVGML
jgi:succinoglycan biosynthesis transport protein ExoP